MQNMIKEAYRTFTKDFMERFYRDAIKEAADWFGLKITKRALKELVSMETLAYFAMSGMDTPTREWLSDDIAFYVGEENGWPIIADGDKAHDRLMRKIIHNGPAKGVHLIEEKS
jgi:hypothetical protein